MSKLIFILSIPLLVGLQACGDAVADRQNRICGTVDSVHVFATTNYNRVFFSDGRRVAFTNQPQISLEKGKVYGFDLGFEYSGGEYDLKATVRLSRCDTVRWDSLIVGDSANGGSKRQ